MVDQSIIPCLPDHRQGWPNYGMQNVDPEAPWAEPPAQIWGRGAPGRQGHTSELAGTTNWEGRLMSGTLHSVEKVTE